MKENEIAVLFAAGKGNRLLPITETIPKPLIAVNGTPMIESLIEAYKSAGVDEIYIVVGYKKELFSYLTTKYSNVTLVENPEFQTKNNISSFHAVRDHIGAHNAFLSDADLMVNNVDFLKADHPNTCFFGKYLPGETKEWVFKVNNGRMTELCCGGCDDYNLVGISYWKKDDLQQLKTEVDSVYQNPGHENLFWEEVAANHLDELYVTVFPVAENAIFEIDTIEELIAMDPSYQE